MGFSKRCKFFDWKGLKYLIDWQLWMTDVTTVSPSKWFYCTFIQMSHFFVIRFLCFGTRFNFSPLKCGWKILNSTNIWFHKIWRKKKTKQFDCRISCTNNYHCTWVPWYHSHSKLFGRLEIAIHYLLCIICVHILSEMCLTLYSLRKKVTLRLKRIG